MFSVNLEDVLLTMSASSFLMGIITCAIGVMILVTRATGGEVRAITQQTAQLAQKGIIEDVAGLVGNASALLGTLSALVRTVAGVGVFLTITGTVLMGVGFWILLQIN